jgi:hypothetical protein
MGRSSNEGVNDRAAVGDEDGAAIFIVPSPAPFVIGLAQGDEDGEDDMISSANRNLTSLIIPLRLRMVFDTH